jgi:uncharacterized protein (TIGR02996 family)
MKAIQCAPWRTLVPPETSDRSDPYWFLSDPDEMAFIRAIAADPDDEATRLVYADWLEERGDPRAEFLRVESALAGLRDDDPRYPGLWGRCEELGSGRDLWWCRLVAVRRKSRVLNCGASPSASPAVRFAFRCPNHWAALEPTGDAGVRYCGDCRQQVYRCETQEQAQRHALAGRCIAISSALAGEVCSAHEPLADEGTSYTTGLVAPRESGRFSLPLADEDPEAYRLWGEALLQAEAGGKKRWWQFWK